jgi:hypothetical protein
VFYPNDTRPKKRHFDGPVSLGVQQAVGESPELVPGFTSISQDGVTYPCSNTKTKRPTLYLTALSCSNVVAMIRGVNCPPAT